MICRLRDTTADAANFLRSDSITDAIKGLRPAALIVEPIELLSTLQRWHRRKTSIARYDPQERVGKGFYHVPFSPHARKRRCRALSACEVRELLGCRRCGLSERESGTAYMRESWLAPAAKQSHCEYAFADAFLEIHVSQKGSIYRRHLRDATTKDFLPAVPSVSSAAACQFTSAQPRYSGRASRS